MEGPGRGSGANSRNAGKTVGGGANGKSPEMADKLKEKTKTDVKRQATLDSFRRVKFDDKRYNNLKAKIEGDLAKIRQERVEIEKVKLVKNTWEIDIAERMQKIEASFRELEERDKAREARMDAIEEKVFRWAREGNTGSEIDAASVTSGVSYRNLIGKRGGWVKKIIVSAG